MASKATAKKSQPKKPKTVATKRAKPSAASAAVKAARPRKPRPVTGKELSSIVQAAVAHRQTQGIPTAEQHIKRLRTAAEDVAERDRRADAANKATPEPLATSSNQTRAAIAADEACATADVPASLVRDLKADGHIHADRVIGETISAPDAGTLDQPSTHAVSSGISIGRPFCSNCVHMRLGRYAGQERNMCCFDVVRIPCSVERRPGRSCGPTGRLFNARRKAPAHERKQHSRLHVALEWGVIIAMVALIMWLAHAHAVA